MTNDSRALVLRQYLSPERLAPYMEAAGGLNAAEELYGWNLAIAGAFYEVLGAFEVTLRKRHACSADGVARAACWCLVPRSAPGSLGEVP